MCKCVDIAVALPHLDDAAQNVTSPNVHSYVWVCSEMVHETSGIFWYRSRGGPFTLHGRFSEVRRKVVHEIGDGMLLGDCSTSSSALCSKSWMAASMLPSGPILQVCS